MERTDREVQLLALIESLPFDVWVLGADGVYVTQNAACREKWGDVVGRRPEDVAPDEKVAALWRDNNRRAMAGESIREEVTYSVQGQRRHLYNIISPIYLDGRMFGVSGANVDITERVEAEQALRQIQAVLEERVDSRTEELANTNRQLRAALEQQRSLKAIVELSPAVAFRFKNSPDWAVQYVSENVAQFGYSAEDFLEGRAVWNDLCHPDDHSRLITSQERDLREGKKEYLSTYRIRTADGTWRWVEEHTMAYRDADGEISHYQGIVVDITKQRQAQVAMARAERMAAVGMLASGVAHEFNNVHTSMLGFIQLARETPGVPAAAVAKLDRSLQIGQRADTITQNLLAYTRSWQGVRRLHPLAELIQDALAGFDVELRAEGIEVRRDVDPSLCVDVDGSLLSQVLSNLLLNAQHALIGRSPKLIRVSTQVLEGQCCVRVEDTGCGIPAEHREQLFLPFFTTKGEHATEGSPQADVRGTGLGLSICETIVQDHGGSIQVESEVDVGTCFDVWLPLASS